MPQTTATLLPWLQLLAGSGSGVVASWLFSRLRAWLPQQEAQPWIATILYAPRYARWFVLLLSALIAVLASMAVAWLTAGDLPAAFDSAVAAAASGFMSQVQHGWQLSADAPPIDPWLPGGPKT